jgi:hypothetical protein
MKVIFAIAALFAVSAASASVIPPSAVVVTRCGTVVAAYEMKAGKIVKHEADLKEFAARVPFNRRIEAGCSQ